MHAAHLGSAAPRWPRTSPPSRPNPCCTVTTALRWGPPWCWRCCTGWAPSRSTRSLARAPTTPTQGRSSPPPNTTVSSPPRASQTLMPFVPGQLSSCVGTTMSTATAAFDMSPLASAVAAKIAPSWPLTTAGQEAQADEGADFLNGEGARVPSEPGPDPVSGRGTGLSSAAASGSGLALSEPQASLARPRLTRAAQGTAKWPGLRLAFLLLTFLWRSKEK